MNQLFQKNKQKNNKTHQLQYLTLKLQQNLRKKKNTKCYSAVSIKADTLNANR